MDLVLNYKETAFVCFKTPMKLARKTLQAKRLGNGRMYDSPELKDIKETYKAHLAKYAPKKPLTGPLRVTIQFRYFDRTQELHKEAEAYTLKPDCDNAAKLFIDCMAALNFFKDDKQIYELYVQQVWTQGAEGVFVEIIETERN